MASSHEVKVGRVYEGRRYGDGRRVLVDRLWPRGLGRDKADVDEWCKVISPSSGLRSWYAHDPSRAKGFARRYRAELQDPERAKALEHLRAVAARRTLTLLTATRNLELSHAVVLADVLRSG